MKRLTSYLRTHVAKSTICGLEVYKRNVIVQQERTRKNSNSTWAKQYSQPEFMARQIFAEREKNIPQNVCSILSRGNCVITHKRYARAHREKSMNPKAQKKFSHSSFQLRVHINNIIMLQYVYAIGWWMLRNRFCSLRRFFVQLASLSKNVFSQKASRLNWI